MAEKLLKTFKNLFIAVFILIGTFSFSKSSNYDVDISELFGTCTVTIVEYDENGNSTTTSYIYHTSTEQDCINSAQAVVGAQFRKR